MSKFWGTN